MAVLGLAVGGAVACGPGGGEPADDGPAVAGTETATERKYLLERVGEAAVVQLYADGFEALPLDQKTLVYHLYRAALAGRDIFYDQRYAHNLEMREVLEQILTHADGVEAATRREIERYTKLFWINTGPYNNLTARKFVLTGPPKVDGHFPVARAWHPMHGNGHGIARRNNDDRDRVHAIMEAADALLETDNAFLIGWGVEGTHWTLGDDGKPQWTEAFAEGESRQGLGLGVLGRSTPIPFGFSQWFGTGDARWGSDPTILEYVQEVRFNPDGVLGPNNLCVNVTSFVGAIDENGDDLRAGAQELLYESVAVFGAIITGQQPASAYQDWIDRYNAGPGPAIEAAATNAWGSVVKECPTG